ncbi:unnamed protein product [Phytophthora fragariaefolia]|uniref:Unnamed protein product n=1 Tax=Phytophthora fragariaefolia TaxID=1490495 RepID=A0A9W6XR88_9STRA|nr:unnamed protein product [Phytophthora fragariaefolia]
MHQARRRRDATWHRRRRNQGQSDTRHTEDSIDDGQIEETSHLDQLLQEDDEDDDEVEDGSINIQENGNNEEAVGQDLLELADFKWSEIDLDAPAIFTLDADGSILDVDHESNEERVEDEADCLGPRNGANDCRICLRSCGNCRDTINLDVEEDEAVVVGHVPAPPTCLICKRIIQGIVLEGPQCDHKMDYDCLRAYNEQYLGQTRHQDFLCPACQYPFPVDLLDDDDDEDTTNDDHNHDNAFECEEPHSVDANPSATGSDSNSADEYHPSDFNSESDDSDDDYHLGDD